MVVLTASGVREEPVPVRYLVSLNPMTDRSLRIYLHAART